MEATLQGFLDFHGESLKKQYEQYIESLKSRKEDIESITKSMEKIKIEETCKKVDEKPKKKEENVVYVEK